MEINGKPRIVIWFLSPDQRFIGGAVNILERQFNGVDIVGVTANVQVSAKDNHGRAVPFIPIQELSGKGGGVRRYPCCRCKAIWYVRSHKICTCN